MQETTRNNPPIQWLMTDFSTKPPKQKGISDAIETNLKKVTLFEERQHAKRTLSQRIIERTSLLFGSRGFLIGFVVFCAGWIGGNVIWDAVGNDYFDDPPFPILESIMTFVSVLITMAVLVRQNRLGHVEESRTDLALQVNLLAEQKVTKLISLIEELRRDMPGVSKRQDEQDTSLQAMTDPDDLLAEIENRKVSQTKVQPKSDANAGSK